MNHTKVLRIILFLAGLVFFAPGIGLTFFPESFTASTGVDFGGQASLLNQIRALGGIIFGCGIVIMLGALYPSMAFTSTVVASVAYLSLGIGRAISIALDGMPADGLVGGTIFEFVVGLAAIYALVKYRAQSNEGSSQ